MKRRQIITRAGVAAMSGTLAACGVGSDPADSAASDSTVSSKELGEGAAGDNTAIDEISAPLYTLPTCLVPSIGQWQVEITWFTTRACSVDMATSSDGRKTLSTKDVTQYISSEMGFALYSAVTGKAATLYVNELATSTRPLKTTTVGGSDPGNTATWSSTRVNYQFVAVDSEYRWTFWSQNDGATLCYVRFFRVPAAEWSSSVGPAAGRYILPIATEATHKNTSAGTLLYPKLHYTGTGAHNSIASQVRVIKDLNSGKRRDTLVLMGRNNEWRELAPTYLAASDALKPLLLRRLMRHADHHGSAIATAGYIINDPSDVDLHHFVGNEVLRLFGGDAIIERLKALNLEARTYLTTELATVGSALYNFCVANVTSSIYNQNTVNDTRTLLASADAQVSSSNRSPVFASSLSATTAVQMGFSGEISFEIPFLKEGVGVRFSTGLAWGNIKKVSGVTFETRSGDIGQRQDKGVNFGLVLIGKIAAGAGSDNRLAWLIGDNSLDIEITCGCLFMPGQGLRLDYIQIDPVIDIDTRSRVGTVLNALLSRVTGYNAAALQSITAPAISAGTTGLAAFGTSLANSGLMPLSNPTFQAVQQRLMSIIPTTPRTYGIAEISVLRFYIYNTDVNDETRVGFRTGWKGGATVGWQPGVKYIAGVGLEKENETKTAKGYVRVVTIIDLCGQLGTPTYIKSAAYSWSHA